MVPVLRLVSGPAAGPWSWGTAAWTRASRCPVDVVRAGRAVSCDRRREPAPTGRPQGWRTARNPLEGRGPRAPGTPVVLPEHVGGNPRTRHGRGPRRRTGISRPPGARSGSRREGWDQDGPVVARPRRTAVALVACVSVIVSSPPRSCAATRTRVLRPVPTVAAPAPRGASPTFARRAAPVRRAGHARWRVTDKAALMTAARTVHGGEGTWQAPGAGLTRGAHAPPTPTLLRQGRPGPLPASAA